MYQSYCFPIGKKINPNIQQGQEKMRQAFGEHFTPAFVPPYHGYNERTLQILQQENFQIFSAGSKLEGKFRFIDVPTRISFSRYDTKKVSINTATNMMKMLAKDISHRPFLSIVTHHADFTTAVSRKELTRFFNLIEALRNKKEWRVLLFSDLQRK